MNYSFHPKAESELLQTVEYYEKQEPGLGLDFSAEVFEAIQLITSFPDAWPEITDDICRCMVHRFPYGVLYTKEAEEIYIIAIMNLHRKPGYWKKRVAEDE